MILLRRFPFLIVFFIQNLFAQQPGDVDSSFNIVGYNTNLYNNSCYGTKTALQSDGKIIVAGVSFTDIAVIKFVCRYNTDGTLDETFGTAGFTNIEMYDADITEINSIDIQLDDKIILAGEAAKSSPLDYYFLSARLTANGLIDSTYSSDGFNLTNIVAHNYVEPATCIRYLPDGKILVGGYCDNGNSLDPIAFVRYLNDGEIDESFGYDGIMKTTVTLDDLCQEGQINAMAVEDSLITAVGNYYNCSENKLLLVRYLYNGFLDNSFGDDGIVITNIPGTSENLFDVGINDEGKIFAAGKSDVGFSSTKGVIVSYLPNGDIDSTFAENGILFSDSIGSFDSEFLSIAIQQNNKLLVCGPELTPGLGVNVLRFNSNGTKDLSFSTDGITDTDLPDTSPAFEYDYAYDLVLQNDGKIVVTGKNVDRLFVLRYLGDSVLVNVNDLETPTTGFLIFPNPCENEFVVQPEDITSPGEISIYSIDGKLMFRNEFGPANQYEIKELGFLSPGLYCVILKLNGSILTQNLIKL